MNLNVDTEKINDECEKLLEYINNYEENNNNFFYELSKLTTYWNDGNTQTFLEKKNRQQLESLLIIENLKKISFFYSDVVMMYEKIFKDEE